MSRKLLKIDFDCQNTAFVGLVLCVEPHSAHILCDVGKAKTMLPEEAHTFIFHCFDFRVFKAIRLPITRRESRMNGNENNNNNNNNNNNRRRTRDDLEEGDDDDYLLSLSDVAPEGYRPRRFCRRTNVSLLALF